MTYETLILEKKDGVATVTIHRPDRLNALNALAKRELADVFSHLKADGEVSVVILTGSGEKAFVAGTDIGELASLDEKTGAGFSAGGQKVLDAIEGLGKPVLAAVNGYALGGGMELALACHIRIASETARFGQPEVNLGIIPGYGGTQRLPRLVGKGRALEMILTGRQMDAREALEAGLVERVVAGADLMSVARETALAIASRAQPAVRLALQAVEAAGATTPDEGLRFEAALFGACCATEDFREGVAAFLEKRKPRFQGR
ncbi:MAG: enoyl-CoA hydratase-related protein [Bacteroidota bacterium]